MRSGRWPSHRLNAQGGLICHRLMPPARTPQQHAGTVGRDARYFLLAQFCSPLGRLWLRLWRAWHPEVTEHPANTHTALTSERSAILFKNKTQLPHLAARCHPPFRTDPGETVEQKQRFGKGLLHCFHVEALAELGSGRMFR